nr:hypothetical protein CFP56_13664 [Quercus suber]
MSSSPRYNSGSRSASSDLEEANHPYREWLKASGWQCVDEPQAHECSQAVGYNYVESMDMHVMLDVVLEKGGNRNTNVQSHMSHYLTPSTKHPTWTRIARPRSYVGMDTLGGQIQHVGHKREFVDSGVTMGHEKAKDWKWTKIGVSNA